MSRRLYVIACLLLSLLLGPAGCAIPQVSAEDRLFLDLQVEVLDRYDLPQQNFEETTIGGLSAIAYDPSTGELYALSDDRGRYGPPRFYRLGLELSNDRSAIAAIRVASVTPLRQSNGQPLPPGQLDPEGMALSPRGSIIISSEGNADQGVPSFLGEFDRPSGQLINSFRLPDRYLPSSDPDQPPQGVQNNLSLEALTLSAGPSQPGGDELFRLFTATESALIQDYTDDPSQPLNSRFLHYLLGQDQTTLISEHRYPLDLEPTGAIVNGLSEILLLDRGGHFLALERVFGLRGFQVKLYQLATGGATDISAMPSLKGNLEGVDPIRKRLLLDFTESGIADIDNLEGMTLGPPLGNGDRSLILVSDNNFNSDQPSQFWLLRLRGL